jgi:U-box domain-containing protein 5
MNFMTEGIGTTISVNTVESDGYEAKNLLSSELSLHSSRGFLADSFVRPPVVLSIKFPLCIEVSHVVINPKLGKQITSAILIHTETSYRVSHF